MQSTSLRICLWFDQQAEEAVQFYTSIFADSEIGEVSYFGTEGFEHHGMPAGTVATIDFRLNHMHLTALNGGPIFTFNEAISIVVECDTQTEIDHYWKHLSVGGEPGPCGWLKDRFGVSWQINPRILRDMLRTKDIAAKSRVEQKLYTMQKLDIAILKSAFDSEQ